MRSNPRIRMKDLKSALQKLSYHEMEEAVMEYAQTDKDFAASFYQLIENKLKAGGEEESRSEVDELFSQTRPMGGRYDRYEDTDWYAIMHGYDDLFDKARQALELGNLRRAVAYPLQWLTDFSDEFTEAAFAYDDEGIEFGDACEEALAIIEQVMVHPQASADLKEEIYEELYDLDEGASVFDDYDFANLSTFTRRMEAMTLPPEKALASLESLIKRNNDPAHLDDLIIQKGSVLLSMSREEEALRFWEEYLNKPDVCMHLVSYLIEKKAYERAIATLEEAILQSERYEIWQWLSKEIDIYKAMGLKEKLIETYRRLFIACNGLYKSYEALKSLIPVNEWKPYLAAMMEETDFSTFCCGFDDNVKAEILLNEQDLDGLSAYLLHTKGHDMFGLCQRYATRLPVEKQAALIPNYAEELREEASEAKKRNDYSSVRYHLENLRELAGSEETVSQLVAEFRELYSRRPAFMNELKRLDAKE